MKKRSLFHFLFLLLLCLLIPTTCKKLEKSMLVSTGEITNILTNSADASGEVVEIVGGVTQHGHCYAKTPNATILGLKTELGAPAGIGGFTSQLTNLDAATKYYIKAYLSNGKETVYGKEINFTTVAASLPTVTSTEITSITTTSAVSGGNITSDGGASITVRGICWNSSTGPSTTNNKTTDGIGSGSFTSNLTGLTAGITYYVRAYATNSVGTAYGDELSFTTSAAAAVVPTLTTSVISDITQTSATSGGNITSNGGTSVTARGVCWSTIANPTIADAKTTDGAGTGAFLSNITGLVAGTTYHVRAYATNSYGTAYGEDKTFITLRPPLASTLAATNVRATSATFNGTVNAYNSLTTVSFEYGLTTSYGSTIAALQSPVTGSTSTGVNANTSGLSANTTYHFRAIAASDGGTTNGNDISFTTASGTVGDVDGNVYNTVIIGTQTWMAENLKTTKYNDGTSISLVTDGTAWSNLSTPGFSWYNNDAATNKDLYGALYNWYSVITGKLCPAGWHVPTDAEWTTLTTWLGGETIAGGKLKETGTTHWTTPNTGATNESGFTALPGGYRTSSGPFGNIGITGNWWSSTEESPPNSAWFRNMYNNFSVVTRGSTLKWNGMSVRCIKD